MKKVLYLFLIIFIGIALLNIANATDIQMNLDRNDTSSQDAQNSNDTTTVDGNATVVDNTTVGSDSYSDDYTDDYMSPSATTTTTNYEDSGELTVSNMINIILIVVGVVLILLGIAIIIKLK